MKIVYIIIYLIMMSFTIALLRTYQGEHPTMRAIFKDQYIVQNFIAGAFWPIVLPIWGFFYLLWTFFKRTISAFSHLLRLRNK